MQVRPVVAAVMGFALLAGTHASSSIAQGRSDVRIAFQTDEGQSRLEVFSGPVPFVIDLHALRFTVRAYDGFRPDPTAPALPIHVELGPPVAEPNSGLRPAYRIAITVAAPPRPGMYELSAETLPGFARTANGDELPARRFLNAGIGTIVAWWPDVRGGDPGLRDVRTRFANRAVHGYADGNIPLQCPNWGTAVGPAGARIGAVVREIGHAEILHPGTTWGGDVGPQFLAFDPLALRVVGGPEPPPLPSPLPALIPCDFALHFADPWHVDTTITTAAPPRLSPGQGFAIRPGMSRDEVIWRAGYPNEFGTAAQLRAENEWRYISPTPFSWSVTFAHDRVVHVDPPGRLP